ncbi:MAG TPA: trypsin-like peptidase domain-containing protein [Streptosporangiaceae bacterium]|jgi:serine protease Do
MTIFDEIQASIARLAEDAGPSVAGIGQRWGIGSGIVLGEGRVLTNAHNVRGSQATVTFADGRTAEGTVAGHDIDGDLAVIEADTGQAAALPWATAAPAIGTPVFALSNPGGRGLRVTFGTVSGIDRTFRGPRGLRITGSLEHTAPLLPGSSGGPVLDAQGQLLGINTNRLGEGFYLAIPADEALRGRVDALARGESVRAPQLGIAITPGHVARRLRRAVGLPDTEGLLIRGVAEDSPAARAGLASGDLIVAAAGQPVRTVDDLSGALRAAGETIDLTVLRGTDERSIQVAFGQNSQPEAEA